MPRAFILELHADESGVFHQVGRDEPFVIALIYRDHGLPGRAVAETWWSDLQLGHYSRFHATEARDKKRLERAVEGLRSRFHEHDDIGVTVVYYLNRPGRRLPRSDVHLDLLLHAVVVAVRERVKRSVRPKKRRPVVLRLNIARRNRINPLVFEKVVERAIRADLELFDLMDRVQMVKCEATVLPAQSSVFLTMSDLLCNHWYRSLKRGQRLRWRRGEVWEVPPKRLGTWMSDADFDALGAVFPRRDAQPDNGLERIARILEAEPPWKLPKLAPDDREAASALVVTLAEEAALHRNYQRAIALSELVRDLLGEWGSDDDLLHLAADSVRVTADNHRGLPGGSWLADPGLLERSSRLIKDPAHWEQVARFHNRVAVARLHAFDFEGAKDQLDNILQWFRGASAAAAGPFEPQAVTNHTLGMLLGTWGQCLALLGEFDEAEDAFTEAMQHFSSRVDLERQRNYLAQVALARVRTGELDGSEPQFDELLADYRDAPELLAASLEARSSRPVHWRHAYRAAVLCKLAWLTGRGVDALHEVAEILDNRVPRGHPYEQICGVLALTLGEACPDSLVTALADFSDDEGVVGVIARAWLVELGRLPPISFREAIPDGMRVATDAEGVDALPYYYL